MKCVLRHTRVCACYSKWTYIYIRRYFHIVNAQQYSQNGSGFFENVTEQLQVFVRLCCCLNAHTHQHPPRCVCVWWQLDICMHVHINEKFSLLAFKIFRGRLQSNAKLSVYRQVAAIYNCILRKAFVAMLKSVCNCICLIAILTVGF